MVLTCKIWESYLTDAQAAVHIRNTVASWPYTLQHWLKNSKRVGIFRQAHAQYLPGGMLSLNFFFFPQPSW